VLGTAVQRTATPMVDAVGMAPGVAVSTRYGGPPRAPVQGEGTGAVPWMRRPGPEVSRIVQDQAEGLRKIRVARTLVSGTASFVVAVNFTFNSRGPQEGLQTSPVRDATRLEMTIEAVSPDTTSAGGVGEGGGFTAAVAGGTTETKSSTTAKNLEHPSGIDLPLRVPSDFSGGVAHIPRHDRRMPEPPREHLLPFARFDPQEAGSDPKLYEPRNLACRTGAAGSAGRCSVMRNDPRKVRFDQLADLFDLVGAQIVQRRIHATERAIAVALLDPPAHSAAAAG